jgi:hypothetical protein
VQASFGDTRKGALIKLFYNYSFARLTIHHFQVLGNDHPDVAKQLNNLALICKMIFIWAITNIV